MSAYYNEIDPRAAAWLRELMIEGLIAPGEVDERSIEDVTPSDVEGFDQCHWFAGIGGWSYALRLAGWPDEMPVWTMSCPCQPFSTAGKRAGFADQRHLWPSGLHLIQQRRPVVIFGEQVAKKPGLAWLDVVQHELDTSGYRVGHAVLAAAGIGAPHIRERTYWVADSRTLKRSALFGGRKGLPIPQSVALESQQQRVPLSRHAEGQNPDASAGRRSRTWRAGGPPQQGPLGQQTPQLTSRVDFREQSQQSFGGRRGDEASSALGGVPTNQQEIPIAWVFCDEGGGDCGEDLCVEGSEPPDSTNSPVADSSSTGLEVVSVEQARRERAAAERSSEARELGDAGCAGGGRHAGAVPGSQGSAQRCLRSQPDEPLAASSAGSLGESDSDGRIARREATETARQGHSAEPAGSWNACDWIPCRDGKLRPVESRAQQMVDGLSVILERVRCARDAEKEALIDAANSHGFSAEILQAMRSGVAPEEIWHSLGGRFGFPETNILLATLCEHSWELGSFFHCEAPACSQERKEELRAMRRFWETPRPPQGREFPEQRSQQLANVVRELSQKSAPMKQALELAHSYTGFPLAQRVPGRVGLLRGYGNAIVPQLAAEFVKAYMDVR